MPGLRLDPTTARRLAVARQCLVDREMNGDEHDIMDVARHLRAIQVDPINAVARTQLLVLFSRLGSFDPGALDVVQWERKELFHYWAHEPRSS